MTAPEIAILAGHAGLVRLAVPYKRIAFLSDFHVPYHDVYAVEAAIRYLKDWQPDLVIVGGDLLDCYSISRFPLDPGRKEKLQDEIDQAQDVVERVDKLGCDVHYLLGNHEDRLTRLITDNPGLHGMRALNWKTLAGLPARWNVHNSQTHLRIGSVCFLHGDLRGGGGGQHVAAGLLRKLKTSCVFGHYHRTQRTLEPSYDGTVRGGFAVGHLCDVRKADYLTCPDWTPGFATVDYDHKTGLFDVRQHLIAGGLLRIDGKTYTGRTAKRKG
jgi:predicted phosphodiesterase